MTHQEVQKLLGALRAERSRTAALILEILVCKGLPRFSPEGQAKRRAHNPRPRARKARTENRRAEEQITKTPLRMVAGEVAPPTGAIG
jgi:hypothetical protein